MTLWETHASVVEQVPAPVDDDASATEPTPWPVEGQSDLWSGTHR